MTDELRRQVRPYAIIPAELIRDRSLSSDARWLMTVMLDRPDGWRPNARDMAARSGMSRGRVLAARRELIACGWLVEERARGDDGTIRTITHILDRPIPPDARQQDRLDALQEAYRRQAGDQLELGLEDDASSPPVDNVVDDAGDRSPTVGPRSDQHDHDETAGRTGVPLTGSGQANPLVTTDRRSSRARAPEGAAAARSDDHGDPDDPDDAGGRGQWDASRLLEVHPWLQRRPTTTRSSPTGDDDGSPASPSDRASSRDPAPPRNAEAA